MICHFKWFWVAFFVDVIKLFIYYFEIEWNDFAANWQKWSTGQGD